MNPTHSTALDEKISEILDDLVAPLSSMPLSNCHNAPLKLEQSKFWKCSECDKSCGGDQNWHMGKAKPHPKTVPAHTAIKNLVLEECASLRKANRSQESETQE